MKTLAAAPVSSGWDFLNALDSPIPADIRGTLEELGVQVLRETVKDAASELVARCPMHEARTGKEDSHPSFSVNSCTGVFNCFSCGYQGAFVQLVMDALDLSPADAGMWILSRRSGGTARRKSAEPRRVEKYHVGELEYSRMAVPPMDELQKRGIKRVAADAYGLRWKDGSWIIPIRNQFGDLMGWQEKRGHTFINRPNEVRKSQSLFGWNRFTAGSIAILVESPLDAVRIASLGIPGAVASYGAMVSDAQMRMIKQNASALILALDNPFVDRAGREAADQIYRRWSQFGLKIRFFNYKDMKGKDAGELTDEEIERGIETACTPRGLRVHG